MTQPAAERAAAEAQLRAFIASFAPAHAPLVAATRACLRKRLPHAHELVYEYRDCFVISVAPGTHGYEGALALRASADAVALYFNFGKDLPDPAKRLQGSGKQTRSLRIEDASTLADPVVAALIDAAIARSPVPYPTAGDGSVLVRPTTATKRRQAAGAKESP